MSGVRSVGVVGLGLIGGSLARDLSANGMRVLAHDSDPDTLRAALAEGVVHARLDPRLLEDSADAEIIVIAVPVSAALDVLAAAADFHPARTPLITDVCSTKHTIGRTALRLGLGSRFVGGHPLAGDHRAGWAASRTGLFMGATVYLCPTPESSGEPLARVHRLWRAVGAVPEVIDAEAHDRLLAWTSHLPQATATALARVLARAGIGDGALGPGGRDMTRLAGSSAEVWTPIALDNAVPLRDALAGLEAELAALRDALGRDDHAAVRRFFEHDPPGSQPAA